MMRKRITQLLPRHGALSHISRPYPGKTAGLDATFTRLLAGKVLLWVQSP
ncbi:MAG: hypothetical protein K1V84_05660 [Muribaculaceae bacterium]